VRQAALALQPVVPDGAGKLLDQLAVNPDHRDFSYLGDAHRLVAGQALPAPEGVFPRLSPLDSEV